MCVCKKDGNGRDHLYSADGRDYNHVIRPHNVYSPLYVDRTEITNIFTNQPARSVYPHGVILRISRCTLMMGYC